VDAMLGDALAQLVMLWLVGLDRGASTGP